MANIAPEIAVAIYESHRRGDHAAAKAAQASFGQLKRAIIGTAPGAVKVAMGLVGVPVGPSRSPIGAWSAEQKKAMQGVLGRIA